MYHDQLRKDPTLVLAQLLLDSPNTLTEQLDAIVPKVAEQVAAYAPGAEWVQTTHLLREWFGPLAPDAKQFVVDRFCTVATEFGGDRVAQRLREAHQGSPRSSSSEAIEDTTDDPMTSEPGPYLASGQ
ncbi:hypothetical protein ACYSUO_35685 [Streptomyces sp. UC4497]